MGQAHHWAVQTENANDAFNFLWAHVLIGSHTSALLPARAAEPPNPGAERGGETGEEKLEDAADKLRRRNSEMADGSASASPSSVSPHQNHRDAIKSSGSTSRLAPLVYPLACVALSFVGQLPRTAVARALAAPP